MLLIAIKSVSACESPSDIRDIENTFFYSKTYFYALIFLILANIVLFFLRRKNDYLVLFGTISIVLLIIPIALWAIEFQSCGSWAIEKVMRWGFFTFLIIFCAQICLWVNKTDLRINKGNMTTIKLR